MTQSIVIAFEGTPIAVRVVPHNRDATKVVLKSVHPEAGVFACKMACIECGPVWQGANFFMVAVDRIEFAKKIGTLIGKLINESFNALVPKPKFIELVDPKVCPECGTSDGTHFQYCGSHHTKLLN